MTYIGVGFAAFVSSLGASVGCCNLRVGERVLADLT